MRFSKWLFLVAGGAGVLLVAPQYFQEGWAGAFDPPAINHPEYFYGFIGAVLAWQLMYLLVGSDPVRYRPAMLLCALAKGSFAITILLLLAKGRVSPFWLGFVAFDWTLSILFVVAYLRLPASVTDQPGPLTNANLPP
jgi:hypothetical protein